MPISSISIEIGTTIIDTLRIIHEAVSRRLPTAAARVRSKVSDVRFVVNKVVLDRVFSEYLRFSGQILFQLLHVHLIILLSSMLYSLDIESVVK